MLYRQHVASLKDAILFQHQIFPFGRLSLFEVLFAAASQFAAIRTGHLNQYLPLKEIIFDHFDTWPKYLCEFVVEVHVSACVGSLICESTVHIFMQCLM